MKLIPHLDFRFITICIKKNRKKNYASYPEKATEWYRPIVKKRLVLLDVRE
jgi:hypothetical protein